MAPSTCQIIAAQQYIVRLKIAVNEADAVEMLQPVEKLKAYEAHGFEGEGTVVFFEFVAERFA